MRDSDAHFILQGAIKLVTPARSIFMILLKFRENFFY